MSASSCHVRPLLALMLHVCAVADVLTGLPSEISFSSEPALLAPYSSINLPFTFKPTSEGNWHVKLCAKHTALRCRTLGTTGYVGLFCSGMLDRRLCSLSQRLRSWRYLCPGWVEIAVQLNYSVSSCSSQQIMVKARAMPPAVYVDTVCAVHSQPCLAASGHPTRLAAVSCPRCSLGVLHCRRRFAVVSFSPSST
jgi:hypothetical protein